MPVLLTAGAAEALAVKIYRTVQVERIGVLEALQKSLEGYQPPVPLEVLRAQMQLAMDEASDASFVPQTLREMV